MCVQLINLCVNLKLVLTNYYLTCVLIYLNSVLQTYVPSRSLCSASERRIIVPSQRGTKPLSQTFSLTNPIW